jgi:SP family facilitated glucose transporter-like MFS transporter 3
VANWLAYACVVTLFGYIIFYQIGLGPIPYFIGSELFEVSTRSAAMSLGSLASWSGNFLVGMLFPTLRTYMGPWVFLIFATVCLLLSLFLYVYLPETRGKEISEISESVSKGFKSRPNVTTNQQG